ncbi:hypothetical protein N9L52_09170 [Litoricolaceae bacterium]|nr:hypothetical protein [Litorivicinaceae bacterium]
MSLMQNLNTLIQYGLPGHMLSRAVGQLAFCEITQVKNTLIQQFIKRFEIQMDEVAEPLWMPIRILMRFSHVR